MSHIDTWLRRLLWVILIGMPLILGGMMALPLVRLVGLWPTEAPLTAPPTEPWTVLGVAEMPVSELVLARSAARSAGENLWCALRLDGPKPQVRCVRWVAGGEPAQGFDAWVLPLRRALVRAAQEDPSGRDLRWRMDGMLATELVGKAASKGIVGLWPWRAEVAEDRITGGPIALERVGGAWPPVSAHGPHGLWAAELDCRAELPCVAWRVGAQP